MKTNLILLAAGNSRRFGSNKLLYETAAGTLFGQTFCKARAVKEEGLVDKIIVVTQYGPLIELAGELMAGKGEGLVCVWNHQPELGISHSIKLGIEADAPDTDAYLFLVCDQPWLTAKTIAGLLRGYCESRCSIGCVRYQDRTGNPVIFSRTYRRELLDLQGDVGGKAVLKKHPEQVYYYEIKDECELEDMDYSPNITEGYNSDSNLV